MDWRTSRLRLNLLMVGLCLACAGLWGWLFFLQVVEGGKYKRLAANLHQRKTTIPAVRGRIYDRRAEILALAVPGKSIFASPCEMGDFDVAARRLAGALGLDGAAVRRKLCDIEGFEFAAALVAEALGRDGAAVRRRLLELSGGQFVWIKRLVTPEEEAAVRALRLPGVHIREESRRFYPHGETLAKVIGFTGVDQQGLGGIESAYDGYLKGTDGHRQGRRDALARPISSPSLEFVPATDGHSVVLTVDANIQDFLERAVEECFENHRPKGVTGIVMAPDTGDILALTERPTFDPNRYAAYPEERWRLRAVTDSFEPGSMFKPFIFAAALEDGNLELDDTIFCEDGAYRIGGRLLHDHHSYGDLSALDVIVKSSNIGMAKIAQRLGSAVCYEFLRDFGFGRASGLGFSAEAAGYLKRPEEWSHYTITSVPMGHEVSVNAVQIAAGFSVFANGGYLVRPRIVRGILGPGGELVEKHLEPEIRRRVLKEETARTMMRRVLREVVTSGTGRQANIRDYALAGKTGTAQKLVDGQYSHSKYVSSFVCAGPVMEPRVVVLLVVDEPTPSTGRYGGTVAAPYAAAVAKAALDYIYVEKLPEAEHRYVSADAPSGGRGPDAP